ncbi:hypothetical protein BU26DRAFT_579559 [Trematosphaeria pertusa]|uniref:Phosphoglycerate mutase-like protein n=1 Tax=Trematosphaeria pertusa TaxID=390896 RepID=A0A6A6I2X3_9PLEO|nr:uncharacterized protein BU26DRAFT_579559 [Trematosphaeria pertusa]KAF2244825.1 hypothetical protein BU26DRAFT_579559 [Trematosphaeria pertusa]
MKIVALLAVLVGAAPVLSNPVCLQNEARAAPTKTVVTRFSYMVPMGVDALTQYFTQEKAAKYYASVTAFGLVPSQTYAAFPTCTGTDWQRFKCYVESHNKAHPQQLYKVVFLARHGEGKHNVASGCDLINPDKMLDADLTDPKGFNEATAARNYWATAAAAPLNVWKPEKVYVSPLRRSTLAGYITFNGLSSFVQDVTFKDELGEYKGKQYYNRRHNTDWIQNNIIRSNTTFQGLDQLDFCDTEWLRYTLQWTQETNMATRVKNFLDEAFTVDADKNFIYITSHGGTSQAILSVLGRSGSLFGGDTGQIYPVLVQYSSTATATITKLSLPPARTAACSLSAGGCTSTIPASFMATGTTCP